MSRILTITSGKGGVGKTNLSLNLALCLSKMGHKTCLFDADLGLANINILLNLRPEYDLKDVLFHDRALRDIIIRTDDGLEILPGSSGVEEMANLDNDRLNALFEAFTCMDEYEFILFDTSAGISNDVISFCLAASEVILVLTPEPTSMVDGFALLKILFLNDFTGKVKLVFNQYKNKEAAKKAYISFRSAVAKHLGQQVVALAMIPEDKNLVEAVRIQRPLQLTFPSSEAAKCIQKMAKRLVANEDAIPDSMNMKGFWRSFLQTIRGPLKLPRKVREKQTETVPLSNGIGYAETSRGLKTVSAEDEKEQIDLYLPVLGRLVESINSISEEIKLIRSSIVNDKATLFHQDISSKGSDVNSLTKPILLDLDAFLKRLQTERKECN